MVPRFSVRAGRQIYFDDNPLIGITKTGINPSGAEALTHIICGLLNRLSETNGRVCTEYLGGQDMSLDEVL